MPLELPGANRLRDAQDALNRAVGEAYAWGLPPALREMEPLSLLLALNRRCAAAEREGLPVVGPGLPPFCDGDGRFSSGDRQRMPGPDGTPVEGGKSTAGMEYLGHTDLTGGDIPDPEERRRDRRRDRGRRSLTARTSRAVLDAPAPLAAPAAARATDQQRMPV